MKKRILAMLLCVVLLLGMLPLGVVAEEVVIPEQPEKPHVHENHDGWTAWGDDAAEKDTLPKTAGQYYLTEDLSISAAAAVASAEQIVLCLNGKSVDCTTSKRAYRLCKAADLTICDCTAATDEAGVYTAGKICNATNTMIMIGQETPAAHLTICDGIYEKNAIASTGSTVIAQGGSQVDIFGGLFRDNSAKTNAGVFYANNGTINFYDGVVENNTAGSAGAAFYITSAKLNMYGGIVRGNKAAHGGGVFTQNTSTLVLSGVQITGNTATIRGAGVDYLATSLTIGGNTVIAGNKIGEQDNNLVLVNGRKLQLDETLPLIPGADIGVSVCTWNTSADYTLSGNVTFGTNATQEDAASYFHSDVIGTGHTVQVKNGNLRFAVPKKEHPVDEYHPADIQWTSWTKSDSLPNTTGYYVLDCDVDVAATNGVAVNSQQQIVLCLNGYTVTGKTRIYRLSKGADVTICDCTSYINEDGNRIAGQLIPGTADGGVAALVADGEDATVTKLTVQDVIINGNGKTNTNGGALQLGASGSQVTLERCQILNCTSTSKGGAIHVANGTLAMQDVTITGCKSAYGGAIMAQKNAKITMTDCTITENTATARAGGVDLELTVGGEGFLKLEGNTVITGNTNTKAKKDSNVNLLNASRRLTFGQLGEKALIGVSAEQGDGSKDLGNVTVCEEAPEGVEAYLSSDAGHDVIREGNALKIQLRAHTDHATDECGHENVTWTGVDALPTESGHYYLTGNVSVSAAVGFAYNTGAEVTICLNGYQIVGSGTGRLFRISKNTKLSICDCTGHGKLTGGNNATGGVAWIGKDAGDPAGGNLTIYGGTVTGNATGDTSALIAIPNGTFHLAGGQILGGTYRAVLLQNGSFTMSGGKIADIAYNKQDGAALRMQNGTFTMTGGEITGITNDKNGGVIRIDKGTATLSGGKISGNTTASASGVLVAGGNVTLSGVEISGNTTGGAGAGMYILNDSVVQLLAGTVIRDNVSQGASGGGGIFLTGNASLTVDGALITGNTAAKLGGGIMHKSTGTLTVLGDTVITGNTAGGADNNLQLYGTVMSLGQLGEKAKMGITGDLTKMYLENGLVIAENATQENLTGFFVSDQAQLLEVKDSKLYLMPDPTRLHKDHETDECGHESVSWSLWADATNLPTGEGHYFLMTDVTLGSATGVSYNSGEEITICLNGFTIRGAGTGRVFRLSNGTKVNVCDCTGNGQITDCNQTKAGIAWIGKDGTDAAGGSLAIYGGTITGNSAGMDGALFYVDGGSFTMAGGTITENNCRILFVNSGEATVSGGKITNNTFGQRDGSVVRMANGSFTMTGGEITNNDNGKSGGVLRMDKGVATISGGKISGNTASGGPALLVNGAEVTLSNVEISGNTATASGGAIYLMNGSKLTIKSGTVIKNNKCEKWGGGLYAADSTVKLEGGSITGNYSKAEGAGVYLSNSTVTMTGGSISYNATYMNGGGVCSRGDKGVFYLYGGNISYNEALTQKSGHGHCGGVLVQGKGSFYMYGGTIRGNRSYQMGGGVRVAANSGLGFYGGTITENHSYRGGGVYTDSPCVIENVKIINNTADYEGGGFYSSGCKVTMNSGIIQGNSIIDKDQDGKPEGNAGGVCARAGSVFVMNGGEILENVAKHGGGMVVQSSSQLIMNDGVFAGNLSYVGYGGALYNSNCTVEILGGEFRDNFSSGSAGAVLNDGEMTVKNATFTGNSVSTDKGGIVSGGALKSNQKRTLSMENCLFEKNTVMGRSGAVDLGYKTVSYISNCTFKNNTASANAGAVSVYTVAELTMNDCTFTGNTAMGMGGGLYSESITKILLNNCTFENNKGSMGGGMFVNTATQATANGCTFTGNSASRGGSGIYVRGGLYLNDTTITGGQGKAHAVTIIAEGNDGESYLTGVSQFMGNVVIEGENGGLELLEDGFVSIHGDGLDTQAKIQVTRAQGGLTKVMVGPYDYVRQGDAYTVTAGELSLKQADPVTEQAEEEELVTDPTEPSEPAVTEQNAKTTVLGVFGIILAVAAVLIVIAVLAVKKMKKRIQAQNNG